MSDLSNTQFFQVEPGPQISGKRYLWRSYFKALKEKGYNPVNQIVGYIMSGDPTYITSYNGARSLDDEGRERRIGGRDAQSVYFTTIPGNHKL